MGLDTVELVMAVEEEFAIAISNEAAERLISVGDVVDHVCAQMAGRGERPDADEVFRRVKAITVEHLNLDPAKVTLNARFVDDLGAD
jgi:acyl carrier protein